MKNWLGRFWPLRIALWLLAVVLSFMLWPVLAWDVVPRDRLNALDGYYEERYPLFSNPVLLEGNGLEAWDRKTGKRWRIPASSGLVHFIEINRDGHTVAVAESDSDRGIVITNVTPPHEQKIYPLPKDLEWVELIMIDPSIKFAVVSLFEEQGETLHVLELATGKIVDTKTNLDQVIRLGNGELELSIFEEASSPNGNETISSSRWKLADSGQLEDLQSLPADAQLNKNPPQPPFKVMSIDGRYEAFDSEDGLRVRVRERSSGRFLDGLPIEQSNLMDLSFSEDGKFLLVGNSFTDFRVFDLETQSLVAEDHRTERRWRRSSILMAISATGLLLALISALRTTSFARMAWDYLLATLFFDSLTAAMVLSHDSLPRSNCAAGAMMAIGIYWAFGPQKLLQRLICGTAGIAVTFALVSRMIVWVEQSLIFNEDFMTGFMMFVFVSTVCGLSAWLMTLPLGWRIGREEFRNDSPRFQFGIGTICLAIAVAAVMLTIVRYFSKSFPLIAGGEAQVIAVAILVLFIVMLVVLLVVWLFLWLWFRRYTPVSIALTWAIVGVISVLISATFAAMRAAVLQPIGLGMMAYMAFDMFVRLAPMATQLAWFSFALWLARRHGYRWVRASKLMPVTEGPIEAVA